MEQVFDMKVKEKKQKLKDSEAEVGSQRGACVWTHVWCAFERTCGALCLSERAEYEVSTEGRDEIAGCFTIAVSVYTFKKY